MIAGERTGRWLLIAAGSRSAAERFAAREGLEVVLVLDRSELLSSPVALRRRIRQADVERAAVHSLDWGRERAPQVAEVALSLAPVRDRWLIDEASDAMTAVPRSDGASTLMRLPLDVLSGITRSVRASARFGLRPPPRPVAPGRPSGGSGVVAIWPGQPQDGVGGSVTHMSGILGAFRRAGLRVAVASAAPLPAQLEAVADDVETAPPPSRGVRLTRDLEQLAANRALEGASKTLIARSSPAFIYQRHRAFLTAGPVAATAASAPLVLEWNASESWTRRNWDQPVPRARYLDPLVARMEGAAVAGATLIAAVSEQAAGMAFDAGARPGQVIVSPNAVDVAEVVELASEAKRNTDGPLLGWVGSFGPWHGAEFAVRALTHLPEEVGLRMIGDGVGRAADQSVAEQLGVSERIEWVGAVPHRDAIQRLADCDVLLAPNIRAAERPFIGSPTKVLEYMAIGRPIVASRLDQIGEVIEHERTGLLVEPEDVDALADAVTRLLDDPELGRALGRAARGEAEARHSWDIRAAAILDALEARHED